MKQLFFVITFALSLVAQANTVETVFKKDSEIPVELQQKIIDYVTQNCKAIVELYGLSELQTEVRYDRVDQGILDTYFTTTLSARYHYDGMHPSVTRIVVESAKYDFYGDNLRVEKATSTAPLGCN